MQLDKTLWQWSLQFVLTSPSSDPQLKLEFENHCLRSFTNFFLVSPSIFVETDSFKVCVKSTISLLLESIFVEILKL